MQLTVTRELLTLIVESPTEALHAATRILNLPLDGEEALDYLSGYKTVVMHRPDHEIRQGGGWYTFEISVQDNEMPIMVLNRTGHWIGDDRIDIPCLNGIHYTHIAQDAHWDPESRSYTATVHVRTQPWFERTAEQQGQRTAQSSLEREIRFQHGPIFHIFWEYWRAQYASPMQQAVLSQRDSYAQRMSQDAEVFPWHNSLVIDHEKILTWQEFRNLKG